MLHLCALLKIKSKSVIMENVKLSKWGVKQKALTVAADNRIMCGLTSQLYNRSHRGLTSKTGDDENL
jgi:hypothetical protein